MLIKHAQIFTGRRFTKGDIAFDREIEAIGTLEGADFLEGEGCYVIPGMVDIHTHGAMGFDFSDGNPAGLQPMTDYYAAHGVTSFLATTMTLPENALTRAVSALGEFRRQGGAKCAGIHLEGPFLGYTKRGAQAAEHLHKPDAAMFHRLNEASGGLVRLLTVACEEAGGMDFIREVSRHCTVSLGHTAADYDTAMAAFAAGASHATHLYNGMPPLHHRDPGVIGAALAAGASVELICDGLHIHPSVVLATYRMFGEKLTLISDSIRCAGMPEGSYELGGQPVILKNGKATLHDGTLAGSSISMLDALRNTVAFGIPLEAAVYAATTAPALAAGLSEVGELTVGKAADLLLLDKALQLKAVWVNGRRQ